MKTDMASPEGEEGRVLCCGSGYLASALRLLTFRASGICPVHSPTLFGTANTNMPATPPISMKVQYGIRRPNLKTNQESDLSAHRIQNSSRNIRNKLFFHFKRDINIVVWGPIVILIWFKRRFPTLITHQMFSLRVLVSCPVAVRSDKPATLL